MRLVTASVPAVEHARILSLSGRQRGVLGQQCLTAALKRTRHRAQKQLLRRATANVYC